MTAYPDETAPNEMTVAQIIAVHNDLAAKPVRKFRDKPTAVRRTIAVIEERKTRAAKPALHRREIPVGPSGRQADELLATLGQHEWTMLVPAMAEARGVSEPRARAVLQVLKNRGHQVTSLGDKTFRMSQDIDHRRAATRPREPSLASTLEEAYGPGRHRHLGEVAEAMGTTEARVRAGLDRLRARGWQIVRTAPKTFRIVRRGSSPSRPKPDEQRHGKPLVKFEADHTPKLGQKKKEQ